jgi:type I restriction enzyme S subunit
MKRYSTPLAVPLDSYQTIIDSAKQIINSYKPTITIDPDWPLVELISISKFIDYRGKTPTKTKSGIPLITAINVKMGYINKEELEYINENDYEIWMRRGIPKKGDILLTTEAPLGNVAQIDTDKKIALAQRIITIQPDESRLVPSFLKYILLTEEMQKAIKKNETGTTAMGIKAKYLKQVKIPVPPMAVQQSIVAQIEAEQKLVDANKELITRFEQKIRTKLATLWGE